MVVAVPCDCCCFINVDAGMFDDVIVVGEADVASVVCVIMVVIVFVGVSIAVIITTIV